jgi:hypothetical protein
MSFRASQFYRPLDLHGISHMSTTYTASINIYDRILMGIIAKIQHFPMIQYDAFGNDSAKGAGVNRAPDIRPRCV